MEIESLANAQLKCKGEKGDYILLLPVGAQIKEAFEASSMFASALAKLYENSLEQENLSEDNKSEDDYGSEK